MTPTDGPSAAGESSARTDPGDGIDLWSIVAKAGIGAWSIVGILALIWVGIWILGRSRILIAPVVLAVALIYVLNPIVHRLQDHGVPRVIGGLVAFAILAGVIALFGFLVVPSIREQAASFSTDLPTLYDDTVIQLEGLLDGIGFGDVELPTYEEAQGFIDDPENQDRFISAITERLGAVTSGILEAILVFFIAPVIAFYVLLDLPRIRAETVGLIPVASRDEVIYVGRNLGQAVGGFLRGQVFVALIVGVLTSVGFRLIGLEFWLIIGLVAGFLNIIPFVGPWVGGGLGFLVGLFQEGITKGLAAAGIALIVQQIDNHFVSPMVLRATVRLHPAVVILALLLGGAVGGLWGVLLAVPTTASVKIVAGHLWRTRVLGQSWEEASDALIIEPDERTTLLKRMRREGLLDLDDDAATPDGGPPEDVSDTSGPDRIDQNPDNT